MPVKAISTNTRILRGNYTVVMPVFISTGSVYIETNTYTVGLVSFRTDSAERTLCALSGSHPQKHVGASLDTLCASCCPSEMSSICDLWHEMKLCVKVSSWI
jgi:hypothetical protein